MAALLAGGAISQSIGLVQQLPASLQRVFGLTTAAADPLPPSCEFDNNIDCLNRASNRPGNTPYQPGAHPNLDAYYRKMQAFNLPHQEDVQLDRGDLRLLVQCKRRFDNVKRIVGHSNLYLLSFDDAIRIARDYAKVGAFSVEELAFLERLFYSDAAGLGFYGDKPIKQLTQNIAKKEVVKIPGSASYLFKGTAEELYRRIRKDIGHKAVLTSGVRNVVKQFHLFLSKAVACDGNLSMASRSIAPPGYSYHGVSDFDIGQSGYGVDNFSERFTETEVYQALKKLDYIHLRYPQKNRLGVRYEPWHIQVSPI
jgi:hypothetical protein